MEIVIELPIKALSLNQREHWAQRYKRSKEEREIVRLFLAQYSHLLTLPAQITLTRVGPRLMDEDNSIASLKYIRDEIANVLVFSTCPNSHRIALYQKISGVADSDPRLSWKYRQEQSKRYFVRVEIQPIEKEKIPNDAI